jgi:hypothetical protein
MNFLAPTLAFILIGGLGTAARSQTQPPDTPAATASADALAAAPQAAPSGDLWRLTMSPYTYHYSYSDTHRPVYMIGFEHQNADGLVLGGSWFHNSFGQPSIYLYAGWRFEKFTPIEPLFAEVSAGLLYGYKPPYQDKVPFNHNGYSPGAVASLGWHFTPRYSAQVNFLGNAALMFQFSVDFP